MFELEIIHAHFELQVSTAESVKMLTYSRLEIVFKDVSEGIHNVMCAQSTVVRFDDILSSNNPWFKLELVSKELNHCGVIADLFRQIGGHSSKGQTIWKCICEIIVWTKFS